MKTPDEEAAARAADDAALAAAEARWDGVQMPSDGMHYARPVLDDLAAVLAIARRALRENRELRKTLERVKAIRCEEHGIDEDSWCYGCGVVDQIHKRTRAAIADTAHGPDCDCGGFDRNGSHDAGEYQGYCAIADAEKGTP